MKRSLELLARQPIIPVLIAGAIIRLIFLVDYFSSPEWNQLLVDSLFHDRWATSIASGNIIGHAAFFRAPLYIYLLGGLYAIFGHSLLAARIFGHLIGLISVFLTFRIGQKLFSKRIAIIAAIIHALYPMAIYFESELLVDSLFTMLAELSILTFLTANERNQSRWHALTGLILGIAAVTRPLVLGLVPLFIIWIPKTRHSINRWVTESLILVGAVALMILPVTLRNILIANDPVLIASSGGINFYLGNNAEADGLSASMPGPLGNTWEIKDVTYLAEEEIGHKLKASQVSNYWFEKGLKWIETNKVAFLKLYLKKLYFCLNGFEISNNRDLTLFFRNFGILSLLPFTFSLILAFAVLSAVLLIGTRQIDRKNGLIIAFVVSYFLLISLFFINARFRLPAVPFIIVLASFGIDYLAVSIYRRRLSIITIMAIIFGAGAFALSSSNFYDLDKQDVARGYFTQANYFLYINDLSQAIDLYHQTLVEQPGYPEANLNLGAVFLKKGLGDSAEYYFKRELELYPGDAKTYGNLASLQYLKKDYPGALRLAAQAIEIRPYFVDPYLISMRCYVALSDTSGFENILRRAMIKTADDARISLDAGLTFSGWKKYDRAIDYLAACLQNRATAIETDDDAFGYSRDRARSHDLIKSKAAYQLGYIYGLRNRLGESIRMSNLAISLDSTLAEAYVNLINGYFMTGETVKARELLTLARRRFPENKSIQILSARSK